MDIRKLASKYDIRRLNEADIESVLKLMQKNPLFFQYCPPMATRQSISEDMNALPPGMSYEDKYYIGYYKDGILIAVMDLILNFPNKETAFIGFFMMDKDFQGKGNGTEIFCECCAALKEEGYRYIRLGFAKGNPQSEAFWTKNGLERTGVEDVQERYTVVVLQKEL